MVYDFDFLLELKRIQSELNHIFERLLGSEAGRQIFYPGVNLAVCSDRVRVIVDLPGVRAQDIRIYMDGHNLVIEGTKPQPTTKDPRARAIRVEREFGDFYRSIPIPTAVNSRNAHAYIKDGLLHIELPCIEDRRQTRIEIPVKFAEP